MRPHALYLLGILTPWALFGQTVPTIGKEDTVAVTVYGLPELSHPFKVDMDGQLRLPMLKKAIPAQGRTAAEVTNAIGDELRAEQLMVDPLVSVTVTESASRPVTVLGAVHHPLTFQATGRLTVLEALAKADGLSPEASSEILLTRPASKAGQLSPDVVHIPVADLIDKADPAWNYPLQGGEEIRVPEAGRLFVMGNVKHPGTILLKRSGNTSLLSAIAQAEGLTPYAQSEAFIYRRLPGQENKTEIPVPIKKIMDRKAPDVPLLAEDILYVPDAKTRRLTVGALEKIIGFGATTASGVLVWGR